MVFLFRLLPSEISVATVPNFPSNSNTGKHNAKYPQDRRTPSENSDNPVEKRPIVGKVTRRKPSIGSRFASVFSGRSIEEQITRVFFDVVAPMARDMLYESLERTLRGMILGDEGPRSNSGNRNGGYSNYQKHYPSTSSNNYRREETRFSRPRGGYGYDDVVFETKDNADSVLEWMYDVLEDTGEVSVAHLLEETEQSHTHIDYKWGWTSLRGSDVLRLRDGSGWIIKLPRPQSLV